MRHFMVICQPTVAKIWQSVCFQNDGRPPSDLYAYLDHSQKLFGSLYHCAQFGWELMQYF